MSSTYTLIPRPYGIFAGLDMTTRYAFGLIWDRWQLSDKPENRKIFTDNRGVYCVFNRPAMAAEMGISLPTLRKAVSLLVKREVIWSSYASDGGAWRYYMPPDTIAAMGYTKPKQQPREQPTADKDPMLRHSAEERQKTIGAAVLDFAAEG